MLNLNHDDWEIETSIYKSLNKTVLSEIYKDGEKRLESIIDDINILKSRSYILLSIFISLLGFLIPVLINNSLVSGLLEKKAIVVISLIDLFSVTYFIFELIEIIKPNYVKLKGEEPKQIDFNKMANKKLEEQEEIYLFNSLEAIQDKISFNNSIIKIKTEKFETIIKNSSIIFLITLITFLIIIKV